MSLYLIQQRLIGMGLTKDQADEIINMVREFALDVLKARGFPLF